LNDGVFSLTPYEFCFEHHGTLLVTKEYFFFFIHFAVIKQEIFLLIIEWERFEKIGEISNKH
jgi:hypothetical protein